MSSDPVTKHRTSDAPADALAAEALAADMLVSGTAALSLKPPGSSSRHGPSSSKRRTSHSHHHRPQQQPPSTQPPLPSNSSPVEVASLLSNISPEVHARIEAFQKSRPSSSGTGFVPSSSSSSTATSSGSKHAPRAYKTAIPDYSKFRQQQQQSMATTASAQSIPVPILPPQQPPLVPSLNQPCQTNGSQPNKPKPQSLSARRGLATNGMSLSGLSLGPLPNSAPATLNQSSASSSTLKKPRPEKPGSSLKLNLDKPENLFSNHRKYIDIKTGSLNFAGKASLHSKGIDFSSGSKFRISLEELEPLGELGRGNYGTVTKVLHKPTGIIMAMKQIHLELEEAKFLQIIMELEVLHKCVSPYIVDFYGAFFVEGAVYLCMEYMDGGSLDKIYQGGVDEPYLAVITDSVIRGLKQLKESHNIIHRDVKPTNILVNTQGKVKLCDFGVSGNLVASIAKTNIGCQSYMAPERIKAANPDDVLTYTAQSDIWSLGLSVLEVAMGCYPYPPESYSNLFSQLSAIIYGDTPTLPPDRFSPEARSFVANCLNKSPILRPTYAKLLAHPWLKKYADHKDEINLGGFVRAALERNNSSSSAATDKKSSASLPPLHNGRPDLA